MCSVRYKCVQKVRLKQVCDGRVRFAVKSADKPDTAYAAVRRFYEGADREILSVLCLNSQNEPVALTVASMGNLNTTRTSPREVFKLAVLSNAAAIVIVHNHPSGTREPSQEDLEFTRSILRAGELLGVDVYDHLIVTDDGYTSLRERGFIP